MRNKAEIIENTKNAINTLRKYAAKDQSLTSSRRIQNEYLSAILSLENRLNRVKSMQEEWQKKSPL